MLGEPTLGPGSAVHSERAHAGPRQHSARWEGPGWAQAAGDNMLRAGKVPVTILDDLGSTLELGRRRAGPAVSEYGLRKAE